MNMDSYLTYSFYTCGPSTRFFFVKSTGFSLIFFPRHSSHSCEARNREEYVPITKPIDKASANGAMDGAPRIRNDRTAKSVVTDVLILLVNVCNKLLFIIRASSFAERTRPSFLKFSRIRQM